MRVRVVAVLASLISAFASARGQGTTVRGVAFDSLRSAPLEGAFIRMTGARGPARTATSDARGDFSFDSVPPGAFTFSMLHAALDSLGFSGISTRVTVGGSPDATPFVTLAVPSFASLWHAACGGGPVPHDTGFVFGTVRDAERGTTLSGATVLVRWISIGVDSAAKRGAKPSVTEQAWGGEVRSDSAGGYTLCGVPSDATLRLFARKDSSSSGLLELLPRVGARVERRDLSLGPAIDSSLAKRGVVSGLVRDADGRPVTEARVITSGAEEVRTGVDGRFVLARVPIGTREIDVLAIGAQPVATAADVTMRDTAFVSVELRKIVELPAVVVTARTARQRMLAEFEERKALGIGHFLDSTRIAPFFNLQNAISFAMDPDAICPLWVDGIEFTTNKDIARELYTRSPLDIAVIETHRLDDPTLPPRYRYMPVSVTDPKLSRGSGCGNPFKIKQVVLVWTKNWLP
jgi:hypothetical protein